MSASFPPGKLRGRAARLVRQTPRRVVQLAKEVKKGRGCRFLFDVPPEAVSAPRVDVVLQEHHDPGAHRAQVFLCESIQERGPDGYLRPRHLRSTDVTTLWWRYVGASKLLELAKAKKATLAASVAVAPGIAANDNEEEGPQDDLLFGS